jgi:hypothetical protein
MPEGSSNQACDALPDTLKEDSSVREAEGDDQEAGQRSSSRIEVMSRQVQPVSLHTRRSEVPGSARL